MRISGHHDFKGPRGWRPCGCCSIGVGPKDKGPKVVARECRSLKSSVAEAHGSFLGRIVQPDRSETDGMHAIMEHGPHPIESGRRDNHTRCNTATMTAH